MPVNRNALYRYKIIDSCLRNRFRTWTLEELIDACSDALYEYEGIDKGVSKRTVQADIETMRSGKLGYEAPIVVIDKKYYSYSDKNFTITNIPLDSQDMQVLSEVSTLLKQFKGLHHSVDLNVMLAKLEDKIHTQKTHQGPVMEFERNDRLKGLDWIESIRHLIISQRCAVITYQSFKAQAPSSFVFSPYLLKEFRNRWFMLGKPHNNKLEFMTLALDRIQEIEDCTEEFITNTIIDVSTFYNDVIGVTKNLKSRPTTVVFRVDNTDAPYVITKPFHHSQVLLRSEPNSKLFSINVVLNLELEREILGFGYRIEVLSPRLLRGRIKKELQRAAARYDQGLSETQIVAKEKVVE